ncbi:MAG: PAS domain-containing protein [Emcibacter sp.]|nr:PAS domain-containing protein [Emcibacter sp.]
MSIASPKYKETNKDILIYIADQDSTSRDNLITPLKSSGYNVQLFTTLNDFENGCKKAMPSVVLINSDFDGDNTASAKSIIKLKQNAVNCPPIIFMSDHNDVQTRLSATRAGAKRFLHKPLSLSKLTRTIDGLTKKTSIHPFRILMIDDDKISLKYYSSMLREAGMETQTLNNPLEALDIIETFKPDIILCDYHMPECTGPELAQIVRQEDKWAMLPIIFLSSESNVDRQIEAIELGGDDFLTKPVDVNLLIKTITAKAKRSRWVNRLNNNLLNAVRENRFYIATADQHNIISTANVMGKITSVNDKFCEISGYSREELIGKNHRLLKSDHHSKEFYDDMWNTISSGKIWHGIVCNKKKDGGEYWVESTIVPFLNDNGKPYKYVSARTDITELRRSEKRLKHSQDFANIGTWDWNILTGELFWSDKIWPLFGLDKKNTSTTYENFLNSVFPDDRQLLIDSVNHCIETGAQYKIEHRVLWPDGTIHWVQENGDVVRDKNGKAINMLGVVQDIDARKQTEIALIEREKQLREAQALAHIGNWQRNLITGESTWSKEIFHILGLNPKNNIPDRAFLKKIIHPDDYNSVYGKGCWYERSTQKDITYRILRPDGTVRYIHDIARVEFDDQDNAILHRGTLQDVTKLLETERKLQETEERFAFAVDGAGDGVWDWDLKTGEMKMSAHYLKMLGYKENEIPQHIDSWTAGVHPDDMPYVKKALDDYLAGIKDEYSIELRLRCKDGNYKWILCRGTVVSCDNNNNPTRMIGIHSNITKSKNNELALIDAREEAENANRAKSQFLSSMSHELRTPMNAIMGFGQLLKMEEDPPLNESQKENVNEIIRAGHHLLDLINEILDLAKIESGRVDLSIETVGLTDIINDCLQLITPLAQNRDIKITLNQNNIPLTLSELSQKQIAVKADRTRLKQILINLLSNAVKYNRDNGELIVGFDDRENNIMRISITDTGHGISLEKQKQLFMPFSRLGAENTGIEGTGIGLVITKNLIELMGGCIGVESHEDKGSTFWIEIICDTLLPSQENKPIKKTHQTTRIKSTSEDAHTILYIEDNPANLRLVTQLLTRKKNMHMWSAHEPLLGLELAKEHKPDLILLDINLPGMDGYEVLKHLRSREDIKNTPVIAVSANAMPKDIEKGLAAGFNDYVTKPIDINNLLRAIKTALQRSE